jgi:hypothetical protein
MARTRLAVLAVNNFFRQPSSTSDLKKVTLYLNQDVRHKPLSRIEGLASQTPKPLNRPLIIALSEHKKFMDFSKYLENP